jgi:predicted nucleic acid-binding protein
MGWSTRTSPPVADPTSRGLLDTSVVVDLDSIAAEVLPDQVAVSAITLAELAAGPMATADLAERARRQDRLQRTESAFDPLPFDIEAARAYGRIYAAVLEQGRSPGRRLADLFIAAVALANDLPLVTRNGADFAALHNLVEVIQV